MSCRSCCMDFSVSDSNVLLLIFCNLFERCVVWYSRLSLQQGRQQPHSEGSRCGLIDESALGVNHHGNLLPVDGQDSPSPQNYMSDFRCFKSFSSCRLGSSQKTTPRQLGFHGVQIVERYFILLCCNLVSVTSKTVRMELRKTVRITVMATQERNHLNEIGKEFNRLSNQY